MRLPSPAAGTIATVVMAQRARISLSVTSDSTL